MAELIAIDGSRFNDDGYIESRIAAVGVGKGKRKRSDRCAFQGSFHFDTDDGPLEVVSRDLSNDDRTWVSEHVNAGKPAKTQR
jgi:hypothetical protein